MEGYTYEASKMTNKINIIVISNILVYLIPDLSVYNLQAFTIILKRVLYSLMTTNRIQIHSNLGLVLGVILS